jgi:hypothetical protein
MHPVNKYTARAGFFKLVYCQGVVGKVDFAHDTFDIAYNLVLHYEHIERRGLVNAGYAHVAEYVGAGCCAEGQRDTRFETRLGIRAFFLGT